MRMMKRLVAGAAAPVIALACAHGALAQTTATQAGEVVVTGSKQLKSLDGVITQIQAAKDESEVTQAFIGRQTAGANAGQLINLIPGVSFVTEDPTGISSGDLRIHGQTSDRIAITIDGAPVNDTGNYATYVGEYLIGEVTDHIEVNLGATDVDSPSAAATAGTINIVSRLPPTAPGAIAQYSAGSYNFQREYAELDSGVFGPLGTRAYVSFNMEDSDKYRGSGTLPRIGSDGRIYQPLPMLGPDSFASVAYTYDQERADFYASASRAQLAQYGRDFDYNQTWFQPTVRPGKVDLVPTQQGQYGNDAYYYALRDNPVDFGQIRGQSYLNLTHGFHFTFDPYFFYTRANGGGATAVSECDPRLKATTGKCVDLNGDGDTLDTVLLYTPSDTQTHRYGLNTSLLYDPDVHDHFQLTYSLDYGRHRQTSPATYINGGQPDNVFGGTSGYGPAVTTSDGQPLEVGSYGGRNRFSLATLNQFAFNYIGKYFDNRLHINLGVRDPFFVRFLNNYCYLYNGTNAYCNDVSPTTVQNLINQANAAGGSATSLKAIGNYLGVTPAYSVANGVDLRTPFTQRYSFNKPLPNAGLTYTPIDHNLLYITYAEGFSAPKTDDLYVSGASELVKPETSTEYGAGWRYQAPTLITSLNYWYEIYRNRIISSPDPNDPGVTIDRNIGRVDLYGIDAEAGKRLFDNLVLYGSASWNHSRVVGNELGVAGGRVFMYPTDDKQLVDTPEYTFAARAQYDFGPASIGLQSKYTSYRYTTDVNDDRSPGFATWDLDARYNLNIFGYTGSFLQVNITNLFDRYYLGRLTTTTNAAAFTASNGAAVAAGTPYFYVGAPRYAKVTLRAAF